MTKWLTSTIDCAEKCVVPPGKMLSEVPKPRHVWNDVLVCPWCDRAFLVLPAVSPNAPSPQEKDKA